MSYQGDIRLGDTIDIKFTTRQATGAPTTLAGSPVISAYVGNGTTEITAGITLTVDFDSRTGLNNVRVVATSGNGFATATNIQLVITTGTVNSVSVVGEVVGEFSIEARSALMPTTVARTLDVSATGEAGVDWANVGSPTTALALTGTTIAVTQKVDVDTIKTNPVVNGGTITFPTTATLASTTNITAATGVDITKILGTAIIAPATAGILDVNMKNIANAAVSTASAQIGVNVVNAAGTAWGSGAITAASIATDAIDADALATDAVTEIWAKACTEPTAVVGASPTAIAALSWLNTLSRNKITQTATTQTLLADDGSTTIAASTLSDDGVTFTRGEFA